MAKYPLIYIEWCDAISRGAQWITEKKAKHWGRSDEWIISEVGFVIKETKKYLLICAKVNYQENGEVMLDQLMKIPKTWILKRKNIKYGKAKGKNGKG